MDQSKNPVFPGHVVKSKLYHLVCWPQDQRATIEEATINHVPSLIASYSPAVSYVSALDEVKLVVEWARRRAIDLGADHRAIVRDETQCLGVERAIVTIYRNEDRGETVIERWVICLQEGLPPATIRAIRIDAA